MNQAEPSQTRAPHEGEPTSASLFQCVGYGLLGLAVLDLAESLYPARFMEPAWETQVIGSLIERSPVSMLGLALVFYGKSLLRGKLERLLLRTLSWVSLMGGISFLLMIPLIIANTFRIEDQSAARITYQLHQQVTQAEKLEEFIANADAKEMESLLKRLGRSSDGKNPDELKQALSEDMAKTKQRMQAQANEARNAQQTTLHKKLLKWVLEALVCGSVFIYIWRVTEWARRRR